MRAMVKHRSHSIEFKRQIDWQTTTSGTQNRRREDVSDLFLLTWSKTGPILASLNERRSVGSTTPRIRQLARQCAQRNLGFHLSASFLCRKPQFNEPLAYSP